MSQLEQYGLPGLVIAGLAWFVMYLMKQHREERKEWRDMAEKRDDNYKETMQNNTNALSGLKALIERMSK